MVAAGSRATSSLSLCLRCQLRQVVSHLTTPLTQTQICRRALHTSPWRNTPQNGTISESFVFQQSPHDSHQIGPRKHSFRRLALNGTIKGKPGRRRREIVASLPSTTLGQQAKVMLVEDLDLDRSLPSHELDQDSTHNTTVELAMEEIEQLVATQKRMPEQDEVDLSIDAIRPEDSFIESGQFEELVQRMVEGYKPEQLALYLASRRSEKDNPISRSSLLGLRQWKPRATRAYGIDRARRSVGMTKRVLAEQIVRSAWNVLVPEEEQRVGEIKVSLSSWQATFLFDSTKLGRPRYEEGIESQTLLLASKVVLDKTNNVMRIIARRQDATEIVSRLDTFLAKLQHKQIDLSVLARVPNRAPGTPRVSTAFRPDNLKNIMQSTATVIEKSGVSIAIYGISDVSIDTALRSLISLISVPALKNVSSRLLLRNETRDFTVQPFPTDRNDLRLCEHVDDNIHECHRGVNLFRAVEPIARVSFHALSKKKTPPPPLVSHTSCEEIAEALKTCADFGFVNDGADECSWRSLRLKPTEPALSTRFVLVLHDQPGKDLRLQRTLANGRDLIATHRTPGIPSLLEFFRPQFDGDEGEASTLTVHKANRSLVARFVPSPFEPAGTEDIAKSPALQLEFGIGSGSRDSRVNVELRDAKLDMHESTLRLLLPGEATDLDLVQSDVRSATAELLETNASFLGFRDRLADSMRNSDSVIAGLPEVIVDVPRLKPSGMLQSTKDAGAAIDEPLEPAPVRYLWQSLEERSVIDFVPRRSLDLSSNLDPEITQFLAEWPKHVVLRLIEVEAGTLGGRHTELHLVDLREDMPLSEANDSKPDGFDERDPVEFVRCATAVAVMITRATNGTLKVTSNKREVH